MGSIATNGGNVRARSCSDAGALFLYVLTNDKRRERREAKYDAKKVHPTDGGGFSGGKGFD